MAVKNENSPLPKPLPSDVINVLRSYVRDIKTRNIRVLLGGVIALAAACVLITVPSTRKQNIVTQGIHTQAKVVNAYNSGNCSCVNLVVDYRAGKEEENNVEIPTDGYHGPRMEISYLPSHPSQAALVNFYNAPFNDATSGGGLLDSVTVMLFSFSLVALAFGAINQQFVMSMMSTALAEGGYNVEVAATRGRAVGAKNFAAVFILKNPGGKVLGRSNRTGSDERFWKATHQYFGESFHQAWSITKEQPQFHQLWLIEKGRNCWLVGSEGMPIPCRWMTPRWISSHKTNVDEYLAKVEAS